MADTLDLKSDALCACGFESRYPHQTEAGILLLASVFCKRKALKINTFEKDVQKDEKSD